MDLDCFVYDFAILDLEHVLYMILQSFVLLMIMMVFLVIWNELKVTSSWL